MTRLSFDNADDLRDFLFTIIESMPAGILLADNEGNILAWNQKARGILGQPEASWLGESCWELLRRVTDLPAEGLTELQNQGGKILCQVSALHADDQPRTITVVRNNLKSPFLHVSGFFLAFEDTTYLAMLEGQVERQKRFAAMQDVAVNMSQELKNPLGGLELYASLLKRDLGDDPENARLAGQMQQAVRTMDHLLNNYVTLVSLPAPFYEDVNVSQWLEATMEELQPFSRDGQIEIVMRLKHAGATLKGDAKLLRQLSFNIGLNGLESMSQGGELQISTRDLPLEAGAPRFIEVRFTDQGRGIPQGNLEKIFDPFFTTKGKANGLGLAIVHHVAEAHHGLVQVESREGKGSVFTVILPYEAGV